MKARRRVREADTGRMESRLDGARSCAGFWLICIIMMVKYIRFVGDVRSA